MKDKKFVAALIVAVVFGIIAIYLTFASGWRTASGPGSGGQANPSGQNGGQQGSQPALPPGSNPATPSSSASSSPSSTVPATPPAPATSTSPTIPITFPVLHPIKLPVIWQLYYNTQDQFRLSYPAGFTVKGDQPLAFAPFGDATGTIIHYPASYSDNTNLGELFIGIGRKTNVSQSDCRGSSPATPTTTNGVVYYKNDITDAGAGNYYETEYYASPYMGYCYDIYLFMHYGNIDNYDPASGIKEFNKADVVSVFEKIMSSFWITIPT